MADALFFSRDTKVFVAIQNAAGAEQEVYEIPVLDGFSFSQATNATEVTLNEMSAGSNNSRRGRKMFNDSLAPAEWSFSTYMRPFVSSGSGADAASQNGTANIHAVEEVLWAMMVGDADHTTVSGSQAANFTGFTYSSTATDGLAITFANSNKTSLGTANIYFVIGSAGETQTVYKIANCCTNEASIDFDIDGIGTIAWSGFGSKIEEVASASTATITEGTLATNTTNFIRNRLTELSAASTLPTSTTYALTLTGGNITISNNITYLTPETLGIVNEPLGHVTGTRSISGSFTCYLNSASNSSMDLFENLIENTGTVTNSFNLQFNIGGGSGPRLQMAMTKCHLEVPTHSIDDVISVEANFHALGTDIGSTDELTLKYLAS